MTQGAVLFSAQLLFLNLLQFQQLTVDLQPLPGCSARVPVGLLCPVRTICASCSQISFLPKPLPFYFANNDLGLRHWGLNLLTQRGQEATSCPSSLASNPAGRTLSCHPKTKKTTTLNIPP